MKKLKGIIITVIIIVIALSAFFIKTQSSEVGTISSEKQLLKMANRTYGESELADKLKEISSFHVRGIYELFYELGSYRRVNYSSSRYKSIDDGIVYETTDAISSGMRDIGTAASSNSSTKSSTKDYSTTNIQVENVDEADINKTDGDYIYSISDYQVVITDVRNPSEIKIASKINQNTNIIPEDLILYNNKLVVIYEKASSNDKATIVKTYNIDSKESPREVKSYETKDSYYTSRCIDNMLFVITSGKINTYVDEEDGERKVDRSYKEDGETKKIPLKEIKYLKKATTNVMTTITTEDLNQPEKDIKITSFLMDVSNAYVSEGNIYLLNQKYETAGGNKNLLKKVFAKEGVFKFFEDLQDNEYYDSRLLYTEIYKFRIEKNGKVEFEAKNKVDGQTINQYSLDEKNGHFRIATYDFKKGAKVTIFDEKMKEIGHSERVGANEKMYSTRFMGDKVYLVTYQTVDPLFVIDLSNEAKPKVLGELSIPGYSMYLHPYDENHIIGIGMETKETVNKDSKGKVTSTTARIVGMKMALFDVSDVRNPKQVSQVVIGDSRTTSAILTNPKALLFSKEKELIAIPVNNYNTNFEITNSDNYETVVNTYKNSSKSYIAEGYCVYKINLENGFSYKGTITHENEENNKKTYYRTVSKMLRGLYIDNNLYTVSESKIKVNNLESLELVKELDLKNN